MADWPTHRRRARNHRSEQRSQARMRRRLRRRTQREPDAHSPHMLQRWAAELVRDGARSHAILDTRGRPRDETP